MATKMPAQVFWQAEFSEGNFWDNPGGAAGTAYNLGYMYTSVDNDSPPNELYRTAMKFDLSTEPDWISLGNPTELNAVLFFYLGNNSSGASHKYDVALIDSGDAWDDSSNWATMEGLTLSAFTQTDYIYPSQVPTGWAAIPLPYDYDDLKAANANGMVFTLGFIGAATNTSLQILKDPAPFLRFYYQYPLDAADEADATERITYTEDEQAMLTSTSSVFDIDANIKIDNIMPASTNTPLEVGSFGGLFDRSVNIPESWLINATGSGSMTISKSPSLLEHQGALITTLINVKNRMKPTIQIVGGSGTLENASMTPLHQELTLADPLLTLGDRELVYRDALVGYENVEVDGERPLFALLSLLINGGGMSWEEFRHNDLVDLQEHFVTTWGDVTYTTAEIEEMSIQDVLEELGLMYGLFLSAGADGIKVFHPAAYSESLRVWEVTDDNCESATVEVLQSLSGYSSVSVNGVKASLYTADEVHPGKINKVYNVENPASAFSDDEACRGLAVMLTERFCGEVLVLNLVQNLGALIYEEGDQLVCTLDSLEIDGDAYMITSVVPDIAAGIVNVQAMRWPNSPSMTNTFRDTGLQGIWRWVDPVTGGASGANISPIGSAGSFSAGAPGGSFTPVHWRGGLCNVNADAPAVWAPTDVANTEDLVDFTLGVYGSQASDPYGISRDPEYTHILSFRDRADRALILGIHRPDCGGGAVIDPEVWANTLFMGETPDYFATPITWDNYVETIPGLGQDGQWRTYSLALRWRGNTVFFYVNRQYIGGFNCLKSFVESAHVETHVEAEHRIGELRWLTLTDGRAFGTERMQGVNGQSNYYP
jgi:hypothetical protein